MALPLAVSSGATHASCWPALLTRHIARCICSRLPSTLVAYTKCVLAVRQQAVQTRGNADACVQELILNCPWGDSGSAMEAAFSQLSRLQELRNLDVSICPLFTRGVNAVMRAIMTLSHVSCLRVRACGLDNDACTQTVVPALLKLTALQSLMLGGSRVCSNGVTVLTQAMSRLTRLSCLRLEYMPLPEQKTGVEAVVELQRQLTRLCRLDLQLMGAATAVCEHARTLFTCHVTELSVRY